MEPGQPLALKIAAAFLVSVSLQAQDHGHLNIGAEAQSQGAKLIWENGADFATATRYVKTLNFATEGKYTGYYQGNISLTALHAFDAFGSPVPNGPAPGSLLAAQIVSVDGPAGGAFQFWESTSTTEPTISVPVGTTEGATQFLVSDESLGAGQPGGDPFGHIHGRRFTVSKPGLYTVGFRAIDLSTQGSNEGPIHTPSDLVLIHFQGEVNITQIVPTETNSTITFGAQVGFSWQLQSRENLSDTPWVDVGDPILGSDQLVDIIDSRPRASTRFYRVTGTPLPE